MRLNRPSVDFDNSPLKDLCIIGIELRRRFVKLAHDVGLPPCSEVFSGDLFLHAGPPPPTHGPEGVRMRDVGWGLFGIGGQVRLVIGFLFL